MEKHCLIGRFAKEPKQQLVLPSEMQYVYGLIAEDFRLEGRDAYALLFDW